MKNKISEIGSFIKNNLEFILTIFVTYAIGLFLLIIQYVSNENPEKFMKEAVIFMVPTTITYTLGCVLVNIAEIIKNKRPYYVWNIFMIFFIVIYLMIYTIYLIVGDSTAFEVVELFLSIGILIVNGLCYREKTKERVHSLV